MASTKTGLNYYTIDTDRYQNRRIKRLKKVLGCQGIAVYDYVLCEIYRVQGCFLEWDNDTAFDVAEYYGLKETQVQNIVQYCGAVGLFDKTLLSRGIITSASIQRRYLDMCIRAKRKDVEIPEKCRIIPEESNILPENSGNIPNYSGRIGENSGSLPNTRAFSKVKKSKVNKNTLSISPSTSSGDICEVLSDDPTDTERERFLKIFFFKNYKNPSAEVDRFINHYKATGWVRKGGEKITDRIALAECWEPQGGNEARFPNLFMMFWRSLYDGLEKIDAARSGLHLMVDSLYGVELREYEKNLILIINKSLKDYLEKAFKVAQRILPLYYPDYRLIYRIYKTTNQ